MDINGDTIKFREKEYTCNFKITIDLIGGKWKTLILWYLGNQGTKRFSELQKLLPQVSHKVLTQQLRELEDDRLLERQVYPQVPPKVEYTLSVQGRTLMPIFDTLCQWGDEYRKRSFMYKKTLYKKTDKLCEEAKLIREEVFVKEQGFLDEFDEIDEIAKHLVFYADGKPAATCRYYRGKEEGEYTAGRIAVREEYRGRNLGQHIMETIEENVREDGGKSITLSAQKRVQGFYEKSGFKAYGEPYLDEHCEHIHMIKILD
ncbi:GNAT family N-acetyltransferase [Anaerocolumna sp. AGMB13020]|uniref:GNAT family N-acetyltransferase n=1 Tax=Anaerocolumna sp. AGMB13020 TaxID=3081750 RepID=UPI002F3E5287